MTSHTVVDSPIGALTLVAAGDALAGLYMTEQRHLPPTTAHGPRDDTLLPALREQLIDYWAGKLNRFDIPLAMVGTAFQIRVWTALQKIPYAETWSYGRVATEIGQPNAPRAVGLANGRNPISIVVPCHRVVGSGGRLTGYGGGLARKQFLLDLEAGAMLPGMMGR